MSNRSYDSSSDDEDNSSVYSDDFDSDSHSSTSNLKQLRFRSDQKAHRIKKDSLGSTSSSIDIRLSKKTSGSNSKKTKAYVPKSSGISIRKPSGGTKLSKKKPNTVKPDLVQSQMLSAQKSRINTLNNELVELQNKLDELVKENRLLKKVQHRQEKSLQKFENKDADIPRLISNYEEELRVLRTRLRKSQEAERTLESKLRDSNDEYQKSEHNLNRLKKLVEEKNLAERSELFKQLNAAQDQLFGSEKKNSELEKRLDLMNQSFTRQVNNVKSKHAETKEKLKEVMQKNDYLENRIKEKERALQVSNIYALRAKPSGDKTPVSPGRLSGRKSSKKSESKPNSPPCLSLYPSIKDQADHLSRERPIEEKTSENLGQSSPLLSTNTMKDHSTVTNGHDKLNGISNELNGLYVNKVDDNFTQSTYKDDKNPVSSFPTKHNNATSSNSNSNSSSASSTREQKPYIREKSFTVQSKSVKLTAAEEEKKLIEDRKKAALIAKMKNMDADSSLNSTPENVQLKNLIKNESSLDQTHLTRQTKKSFYQAGDSGLNSNSDSTTGDLPDDDELMFGGYAPTVTSLPKRKLNGRATTKQLGTPPAGDGDETLFDLKSGKSKNSDLLQQLFGNATKTNGHGKKENSYSTNRRMSSPKATALVSPLKNGYPWNESQTNGYHSQQRKNSMVESPLIKALHATKDDEIEEMIL